MKKTYTTPKVRYIDFTYDEQVTAASNGNVALHGDPAQIGRCQQSSETSCKVFWNDSYGDGVCQLLPYSLRDLVGF